jgi:hypothetical protein
MKYKNSLLVMILILSAGTNIVFAAQNEIYIIQVADAISPERPIL